MAKSSCISLALQHAMSPPLQSLSLPSRSPHPMNPPSNNGLSHSRGGTPNLKSGGMSNARAQQNHTPNQQMMHMGSGNSDSLTTPIVSMPTPSFPGMPPSFPGGGGGGGGGYQGYNDMDSGQMTSYGNSINSNHSNQSIPQHPPSLQRYTY